jgi:hypothetical protein
MMSVDELRLHDVIGEGADQHLSLFCSDPLDAGTVVTHDVEAFATSLRMGAHDRVPHWLVALYFFLSRRKGALACRKVKDSVAAIDAAAHALGQCVPRRRSAGEFGVAERQAVEL